MEAATTGKIDLEKNIEQECISKNWFVIGLAGVSGGGKTTIATKLLNSIPTTTIYISQDEYILPNDFPGHLKAPKPLNGLNKDSLNSIDMVKMIKDLQGVLMSDPTNVNVHEISIPKDRKQIIGSALVTPRPPFHGCKRRSNLSPVLVLDGFLLYNHPELPPLCDARYFITLTKDQCWERRKKRVFTAPNMDAEAYFEHCMWPQYEKHFQEMCISVKNVQFIDGIQPLDNIFEDIFKNLMIKLEELANLR